MCVYDSDYLILYFRYDASTEFGGIIQTDIFLFIFVLRVLSGPRVKTVKKSTLNLIQLIVLRRLFDVALTLCSFVIYSTK